MEIMNPILFDADELLFDTYGLGTLTDAISCKVEEKRNDSYELKMEYPITGIHYEDISQRRIILAKPNVIDEPQPFRIYKITRPINGVITIEARHICYDLSDFCVEPFEASGIILALEGLKAHAINTDARLQAVNLTSDSQNQTSAFKVNIPSSIRSWFGGKRGSLIDVFGGEWHYDGWTSELKMSRGTDRNVSIVYGKNLIDLKQEEEISNVYTSVYSYWKNEAGDLVTSTPVSVFPVEQDYSKMLVLDFSQEFETLPTPAQLTARCRKYIDDNNLSEPKVTLTLDFVSDPSLQYRVDLCDVVTVSFPKLGVNASAKCIRTKYDVLKERYEECELGTVKTSIADTVAKTQAAIEQIQAADSERDKALADIDNKIANAKGFYTSAITEADGSRTLYMHDQPELAGSLVQWKVTAETVSVSTDGGRTWNAAVDKDGNGIFNHLYSIGINANYINTGIIKAQQGNTYWNLNTGVFHFGDQIESDSSKVFVEQPTPPYQVGDLYVTGRVFNTAIVNYAIAGMAIVDKDGTYGIGGDIWVCSKSRAAGDTYHESDWQLVTNYIDDTEVAELREQIQEAQVDISATRGELTTKVSLTDYTGQTIASMINQTPSSVTVDAKKISLSGELNVNDVLRIDDEDNVTLETNAIKVTTSGEASSLISLKGSTTELIMTNLWMQYYRDSVKVWQLFNGFMSFYDMEGNPTFVIDGIRGELLLPSTSINNIKTSPNGFVFISDGVIPIHKVQIYGVPAGEVWFAQPLWGYANKMKDSAGVEHDGLVTYLRFFDSYGNTLKNQSISSISYT